MEDIYMLSSQEKENDEYLNLLLNLLQSLGYTEAEKWKYVNNGSGEIEMEMLPVVEGERTIAPTDGSEIAQRFETWWWNNMRTEPPFSKESDAGFFGNSPILKIYKLDRSDINKLKLKQQQSPQQTSSTKRIDEPSAPQKMELDAPTKNAYINALEEQLGERPVDILEGENNKFKIQWETKQAEYHGLTYFKNLLVQPSKMERKEALMDIFEANEGERPSDVEITNTGEYRVAWGQKGPTFMAKHDLPPQRQKVETNVEALVKAFTEYEKSITSQAQPTSIFKSTNTNSMSKLDNEKLSLTKQLLEALQDKSKDGKADSQIMIAFRKKFKAGADHYVEKLLKKDNHEWGYYLLKTIVNNCKNVLPTRVYDSLVEYSKTKGEKLVEQTHKILKQRGGNK